MVYDTVVIGGGPIGLASAYYSAASGRKTLLLEKQSFFHQNGSSGGNSRFFRVMYSEKPLALLSEAAYALWKQLERRAGVSLLDEQPLLFFGSKEAGSTVEGDFRTADTVMRELGIPHQALSSAEIRNLYPTFKAFPETYSGLLQNDSAVIRVENSLRAFHRLATEAGATLLDNTPARIQKGDDAGKSFRIELPDRDVHAKSLIISVGGWTNDIIADLGVQFALELWQMTICLFEVEDPAAAYPFWYEFGDPALSKENLYYGFPVGTDREGCIKVSCDFTDEIYSTMDACTKQPNPRITELLSRRVSERFRGVNPAPVDSSCCFYTMSTDYHMVLDLLPGYSNVAILAAECGRAFKYAPLFGRILSELAASGECSYNIKSLSAQRRGVLRSSVA